VDVLVGYGAAAARGRDDKGGGCDVVDSPGHASRCVEDGINGSLLEDWLLARASGGEAAAQVVAGLIEAQGGQARHRGDALIEGVMRRLGETIVERGVACQEEQEGAFAVEVGDGEEAQVLNGVVGQLVGFVEDQEVLAFVGHEVIRERDGGLSSGAQRADAGFAGQDVDQAEGSDGAVGEVVDHPAVALLFAGEFAEQEAFAAAGLGDEDCDAVEFDGEAEAAEGLLEAAMA